MAFTTTQRMDNALLRNLSFRTPLNVPISSQHTLYANGQGQTYWSNSVSPTDLSTVASNLSVSIFVVESNATAFTGEVSTSLQNAIDFLSSDIGNLSTYVSTTVSQIQQTDSNLSNSVISLSNNLAGLAYSNFVQINNVYNATISTMYDILNGYSNISTFTAETDSLLGVISTGLSSLSTTIGNQNTSTYNVLTSNYTSYVTNELLDYDTNVSSIFSSIFANYATNYSTQSSILVVENQTQSSVSSLQQQIYDLSTSFTSSFSTVFFSSIYPINSTLDGHELRISSLEALSTTMSSLTNVWISTFVSTSQGIQDSTIQSSIKSLSYLNSSLTASTIQNYSTFLDFSSSTISSFGGQSNAISTLSWQVSSLMFEYSILTTSSILGGIYSSFVQLEIYTYGLVASTYSTNVVFQSSLLSTSQFTIASTAVSYFDLYVSTMYASTLSTLVPSTQAYYSSITSTTLWFALSTATSTINIVAASSADAFYSTTSSLTKILLDSTATQLNSSITGNLIIPTQALLSSFSTSFGTNINTYSTQFYTQFGTQSTMFSSLYCFYSSALSTLFISSVNTLRFLSTQTSTFISSASGQLSTFSTLFSRQLSTQTGIYNSSIAAVTTGLSSTITSTTAAIYSYTISSANTTLTVIQNSTIQAYNTYVTGLNNALSTATYSSLYTEQVLNLTSNTSNAVMDMATYRNFNVNVYNILNANARYRLTYSQNTLLGLDYRTGFIFINVSTVGQSYTSNNSQLQFDAYQWGLPTTVFGNVYPYISNADYTLQYQYVIQNNTLFTSLMNVYPRVRIQTAAITPVAYNVFNNATNQVYSSIVWRGSPVTVSWTKYSFFPSSLGAPPFNPNILIDMRINNSTVAEYGPYPFESTSAVVNAPYLTGIQSSNLLDTTVRVYIAGAANQAATSSFFTLMPTFDTVRMISPQLPSTAYVGGTEIVAITDLGGYPLYSTNISLNTSQISYDNTTTYIAQNINNGILNQVGAIGAAGSQLTVNPNPNATSNIFTEASATFGSTVFFINIGNNYFNNISTISNFGGRFRFTLSSSAALYSFDVSSLTFSTGTTNVWRVDGGIPKPTNTFTSGSATLLYSYTNVNAISSSGSYFESTFCGPAVGLPSSGIVAIMNSVNLSAVLTPVSTMLYYNLLGNPVSGAQTNGMLIQGIVTNGTSNFTSTFMTNGSSNVQIFRI